MKEVLDLRKELKKQVEEEYGVDDDEKIKMLDKPTATMYMQRIRTFTHKIVEETSQVDPRTGRRVI